MRLRKRLRLILAVALCVVGFVLARTTPYRETTVLVEAGGCRLVTDIVDKGSNDTSGSVILLHGIAANKKIMGYMARSFAKLNLRVFVPDLPGHGRTQGPFSFSRAETCAESFTRQLVNRGAIDPARTILAGHSMGGAIAERLASRIPVAGVVAVSPAPMSVKHGIARYLLPFENAPPEPAGTLVISGSWEPRGVRDTARDLISGTDSMVSKYVLVPHATHVSLIFDPDAASAAQAWAVRVLQLSGGPTPPSLLPLTGSLTGFVGVLFLAGPFLRETLGASQLKTGEPIASQAQSPRSKLLAQSLAPFLSVAITSLAAVGLLHFWKPLSFVRLFNGDYFASFLLIVGVALLALHYRSAQRLWQTKAGTLLAAPLAALLLHILVTAWFDATLTEAWLTWFRWARVPVLFVASLAYLAAEELLLEASSVSSVRRRMIVALALRFIAWLALLFALFVLHTGPVLLLLLFPYFALFSILQRAGMDIAHSVTGSAAAAALLGAILLAGFCLVIFPVT